MSDDRKDIPAPTADNMLVVLQRLRETVQTYLGRQGDVLDRGVTLRDLDDAHIISLRKGFLRGAGGSPISGPGSLVAEPYEADLSPPPTPTGFTASAGITKLVIQWDDPAYLQGHGHDRTIVYGATYTGTGPLPTFASAVELKSAFGAVTDYATQPATEWHLWIKWRSKDGVLSASPAGGTNGVTVTTGQDVSLLLAALTGSLTQSQLATALGTRIDLIDGPSGTPGTVNARVLAETTARSTETGYLGAQYTLRLDVGGVVGGFGVSGTSVGGAGATIDFGIRANKFFVMPPAGVSNVGSAAFIYQATPTTINGVSVPAGLYLSDAFIENGTITNVKIGDASIDNAKIASLAVDNAKIANATISGGKIAANTITASNIAATTITTDRLVANAATAASAFAGDGGTVSLSAAATSYTVDFPTSGLTLTTTGAPVKVLATAWIDLFKATAGKPDSLEFDAQLFLDGVAVTNQVSVTAPFQVMSAGSGFKCRAVIPFVFRSTPSAAAHTYKIRFTVQMFDSSGAAIAFGASASIITGVQILAEENKV